MSGPRPVWRCALALALGMLLLGCEAVPSLIFEGDDGGADAPGQCPGKQPQNATCCGTVPCYGSFCSPTNCATCMTCNPGESCCTKSANNAMCITASMICH